MTPKLLYRVASVLLLLYAAGHQLGFRRVDPNWNAEATVAAMKTTFIVSGNARSYWDFFSGFGFFCTGLLLFAAVLAWQLGGLDVDALSKLSLMRWAFGLCFAALTIMTWRFFFPAPTVFSALVTVSLVLAAWQNG
ncbi:MAG: hypothetical protein ABI442_07005 [Gemmatimonadaceae bacterium]